MARRLFALDHAFPQPIVDVLADLFYREVELVPIQAIDQRFPDLEDWQVLLALHHHRRAWDGLVTVDANMLALPREMWVLMRTNLSLVVTEDAGHDPIRATGLLFVHLSSVCKRTQPTRAQVWRLRAAERQPEDPMQRMQSIADKRSITVGEAMAEGKLAPAELKRDPLA